MSLRWTGWIRDPETNKEHREYTTANGVILYEKKDEEGTFYYDQGEAPIDRAVAQQLGLPSESGKRPRTTPKTQFSPRGQHASQNKSLNENYQLASSRSTAGPSGLQRNAPLAGDETNEDTNDVSDEEEEEEEEEEEDEEDDVGPLRRAPKGVLGQAELEGRPLSSTAAKDLQTLHSTGSLPQGYEVKKGKWFHVGKVFRVLWVEPKGTTSKSYEDDKATHTALRPMIVVKKFSSHCICLPVFSYGSQGIAKSGLTADEVRQHAVIHMQGEEAHLSQAENSRKDKAKIYVEDALTVHSAGKHGLSPMSRVRFDQPYIVKYNLKVLDLGTVIKPHKHLLKERWRAANSG